MLLLAIVVLSESTRDINFPTKTKVSLSPKRKTESFGLFTEPQLAWSNLNGLSANFRTAGAASRGRLIVRFIAMCKQRVYEKNKKKERERENTSSNSRGRIEKRRTRATRDNALTPASAETGVSLARLSTVATPAVSLSCQVGANLRLTLYLDAPPIPSCGKTPRRKAVDARASKDEKQRSLLHDVETTHLRFLFLHAEW